MRFPFQFTFLCIFLAASMMAGCSQRQAQQSADDYWLIFEDSTTADAGYKDQQGNIVIFPGEYVMCMTDTFYKYAMVMMVPDEGFVVIDRQENIVYDVFNFDNGADYVSDGLFRIVKNGKIGYADGRTLEIVIQPQFDCAYPFENGRAKVSTDCVTIEEYEHKIWKSDHWQFIDKKGKILN